MFVLYIHGFLSSPQSHKALQTKAFCEQHSPPLRFDCPMLPAYPQEAITILEQVLTAKQGNKIGLIGSSMGGYYATYLSQRYQCPAVLINPAVAPYKLMQNYLNQPLKNYHTEDVYSLNEKHVQEMRDLEINSLQYPNKLWLLVQTGDETLDYRLAVDKYRQCKMTVEEGGDHSFQNFEQHIPHIISFLLTN